MELIRNVDLFCLQGVIVVRGLTRFQADPDAVPYDFIGVERC